jgi:Glycosyl hydrolase family 9
VPRSWRGPHARARCGACTSTNSARALLPAADHLKLMFPYCWAVSQVAWAMVDGTWWLQNRRFRGGSNWDWAVQTLLHGVDFLRRCHFKADEFVLQARPPELHFTLSAAATLGAGACAELDPPYIPCASRCQPSMHPRAARAAAQVGEAEADHSKCFRAELDKTTPRTVFIVNRGRPGSDVFGMAAAAFAAASIAIGMLKGQWQKDLAQDCLRRAETMYEVAKEMKSGAQRSQSPVQMLFAASYAPLLRAASMKWQQSGEQHRGNSTLQHLRLQTSSAPTTPILRSTRRRMCPIHGSSTSFMRPLGCTAQPATASTSRCARCRHERQCFCCSNVSC